MARRYAGGVHLSAILGGTALVQCNGVRLKAHTLFIGRVIYFLIWHKEMNNVCNITTIHCSSNYNKRHKSAIWTDADIRLIVKTTE